MGRLEKVVADLSSRVAALEEEWRSMEVQSATDDGSYKASDWYNAYTSGFASACKHNMTPVSIGNLVFYATGALSLQPSYVQPDVGLYFDSIWVHDIMPLPLLTTMNTGLENKEPYPFVYVDWADYGTITQSVLKTLVDWAITQVKSGKKLEIGCAAGHGRTGVFLACLAAQLLDIKSIEAISYVMKNYCKEVIDSRMQTNMVRMFCGETPLPLTVMPTVPHAASVHVVRPTPGYLDADRVAIAAALSAVKPVDTYDRVVASKRLESEA